MQADAPRIAGHGATKYRTGRALASSETAGWPGLLAERWCHRPGLLGPLTPRDTEVVLLVSGTGRVSRRGDGREQSCDAIAGTLWLCPAGIAEERVEIGGHVTESLHLYLPQEALSAAALAELGADPAALALPYLGGFRDPLLEQIGLALRHALAAPEESRLLAEQLGLALALRLFRRCNGAPRLPAAPAAGLTAARLQRVRDYVEAHLELPLGLADLAREAGLSRYHFARTFRSATGLPPHRYLMQRRVERARGLLCGGGMGLAEIALACGFASQSHFTRQFRAATGITPGRYRRLQRNG